MPRGQTVRTRFLNSFATRTWPKSGCLRASTKHCVFDLLLRAILYNLSQNCRLLSTRYKCCMIQLTDEQWERIRDHFPEEAIADGRPGRKPTPTRCVLEAVLWILNTGAQWHMLPQSYPRRPRLATGQIIRTSAGYTLRCRGIPTAQASLRAVSP